jgi:A/G-specific adenine glycosylase
MNITKKRVHEFQELVYYYYRQQGRKFPWREITDPYAILVSEVMSQQTQIERVVPKYQRFMERWPTINGLSGASLAEVLVMWSGLGYNRRAKLLHALSMVVVRDYKGMIPHEEKALLSLPGIGPYTALAIQAFAFNLPVVAVDTNIRTIYIHHFFPHHDQVHDKELLPVIHATHDVSKPKIWLSALMDYGTHLKRSGINPIKRSLHYAKQLPLKGSVREVRGFILKALTQEVSLEQTDLLHKYESSTVTKAIEGLHREGFITVNEGKIWYK